MHITRPFPRHAALTPALPVAEVYGDESSQTGHRFLVLGAMVIERAHVAQASSEIQAVRERHRLHEKEIKWARVSNAKLEGYRDVVDSLFRLCAHDLVHFHALHVDTSTFDHARFNGGDHEAGFNKLIYQLLLHKVGRKYGGLYRLEASLDHRVTLQHPSDLRVMLNAALAKYYDLPDAPFRDVCFKHSHRSHFIQLCDILVGAIAYRKNGFHERDGANTAKRTLAEHILRRAMETEPNRITGRRATRFTLWPFKYRSAGKRAL